MNLARKQGSLPTIINNDQSMADRKELPQSRLFMLDIQDGAVPGVKPMLQWVTCFRDQSLLALAAQEKCGIESWEQ